MVQLYDHRMTTVFIYLLWIFRKSRKTTVHIVVVGAVVLLEDIQHVDDMNDDEPTTGMLLSRGSFPYIFLSILLLLQFYSCSNGNHVERRFPRQPTQNGTTTCGVVLIGCPVCRRHHADGTNMITSGGLQCDWQAESTETLNPALNSLNLTKFRSRAINISFLKLTRELSKRNCYFQNLYAYFLV